MSKLIDNFINESISNTTEIRGRWYCAKPCGKESLKFRIKNAIEVLTGKAVAVHYKEDEL